MPQNVTVNGEAIPDQEIRSGVAILRHDLEARNGPLTLEQRLELRNHVTNDLIGRLLVFQEARRLNLLPTPEQVSELAATLAPRVDGEEGCRAGTDEEAVRRDAEGRLTAQLLIDHWGKSVKPPSPGEVRTYYKKNRERFARREMIHAAHIVKNFDGAQEAPAEIREAMETLSARLAQGEDFTALAAEFSDCPENGGDLGFFPKGVMVDEFDAQVFDAPLNTPTPVFQTPFGLHIAIVRERREAGIATLEEVAPTIEKGLLQRLQDHEVELQLAELRKKAVVRTEGA